MVHPPTLPLPLLVFAKQLLPCAAGSKITVQWRVWPDGSQDGPIDISHQGPCAVYMKKMGEGGSGSVAGGGWFKIWEDGFRDGKFCTDRLRENGNKMSVTIPSDLAGLLSFPYHSSPGNPADPAVIAVTILSVPSTWHSIKQRMWAVLSGI